MNFVQNVVLDRRKDRQAFLRVVATDEQPPIRSQRNRRFVFEMKTDARPVQIGFDVRCEAKPGPDVLRTLVIVHKPNFAQKQFAVEATGVG